MNANRTPDNTYRFALILGIGSPFYKTIGQGAAAQAEALNISLRIDIPDDFNVNLQIPLIEACIAEKVDALIITPCDGIVLIEPLRRASAAGIKIITVDGYLDDGNYSNGEVTFPETFIGSDNAEGGRIAARALFQLIGGEGKVYIQSTAPGVSATDLREIGFLEVLTTTSIDLVGIGYDQGSIDRAAQQTAELLEHTPDLNGIFGTGDYSTKGVVRAIKQADKQGTIKIARFDASEQAIDDLLEGTIDFIIGQLPAEMGRIAVDSALKTVLGETVPAYIPTGLVLIDRNNINTPEAQTAICKVN